MLETIFSEDYLLFINMFYLYKLDVSRNRRYSCLLNSQNNDTSIDSAGRVAPGRIVPSAVYNKGADSKSMNIQSAENCKGFPETVRQLSDTEEYKF